MAGTMTLNIKVKKKNVATDDDDKDHDNVDDVGAQEEVRRLAGQMVRWLTKYKTWLKSMVLNEPQK